MGHSDYKSIMKILNQNLQEGQTKVDEPKAQHSVAKTTSKTAPKTQTKQTQAKSTAVVVTSQEANKPRTTIKFSFTMNSLVIDLMNTISVSRIYFTFNVFELSSKQCVTVHT